jgi:hypothetical protein
LCEFILKTLQDKNEDYKLLKNIKGTPFSDMLFLELFRIRCNYKCGEMTDIINNSVFDHNINISQQKMSSYIEDFTGWTLPEWEMDGDKKKIIKRKRLIKNLTT